jgi:hypothetical protein
MNKLQLVQRLGIEGGVSGSIATTVGATGEWLRLVTWIDQAWQDVQRANRQWKWMRGTVTFNATQSVNEYAPASAPMSLTNFAEWHRQTFRIYKGTSDDEEFLNDYAYEVFRNTFIYGTTRSTEGYPIAITVSPTKSLIVALTPDDTDYFITGDYFTTPSVMTLDADEPDMPERFHIMIVYKALIRYGMYESASEVVQYATAEYDKLFDELEESQAPEIFTDREFLF